MKIALLLLIAALNLATTNAIRLHYNSSDTIHSLTNSSYPSHNIFISGGSTLQLLNGASITAPSSVDDGESAVRIDDATFIAVNGTIIGGAGFGGIGVTISSSRDFTAEASFGTGMAVYGGDAARNKTTQGGDAVQVIHAGSKATFDGGTKIVAGKGCSQEVCGVSNNGNAIKVIMGEVIVKGGMFDGDFYNLQGSMQIYGCVEVRDGRIEGVLSDGSAIDVAYVGEEEQLEIVYDESVCPAAPTIDDPTSGVESARRFSLVLVSITTVSLAMAVSCL
eukprot:scaffold15554_cov155-Skeletonema_dohrnii-CCMP3373.AAC.2